MPPFSPLSYLLIQLRAIQFSVFRRFYERSRDSEIAPTRGSGKSDIDSVEQLNDSAIQLRAI